ncbi:hypothetical protein [Hymenobacter sp. B81]|uniref:hypothetical protein n=1 Tax=Hymenobacter sp. B81 TaxID=3344878 RepID=UPI0037DD49B7
MTKHFSFIEKFLLVAVSAITIWQFIEPRFSTIESSYEEEKAILPKMVQDTIVEYSAQSISFDVLKYVERNYKNINENNSPIDSLNNILNKRIVNRDFSRFKESLHYHYTINIRNSGSKEIESINVSTKSEGSYVLLQDNKPYKDGFFLGKVELDNMNPEDNATLHIWTMPLYDGDIRINYKGGYEKPEKTVNALGFHATIIRYNLIFIIKITLAIIIVSYFTPKILSYLLSTVKKQSNDSQNTA